AVAPARARLRQGPARLHALAARRVVALFPRAEPRLLTRGSAPPRRIPHPSWELGLRRGRARALSPAQAPWLRPLWELPSSALSWRRQVPPAAVASVYCRHPGSFLAQRV